MTKSKMKVETPTPKENGVKEIVLPQPNLFWWLIMIQPKDVPEGTPNQLKVSNDVKMFIEMIASSEVDPLLRRVYTLNSLRFFIAEYKEPVKK